jgi:hypothetical protein
MARMHPNSLHQAKLRVNWAREKVEQFNFFKQRIWQDALKNTSNNHDAYFMFRERMQEEAIRLTSEFVQHTRAALDYIVFLLAWLDTGSEQKQTQFPIDSTPEKFERDVTRFLKHLTPEHVAMIERFQPYHGFQSLLLLNTLSNRDKHREFIRVNFLGQFGEIPVPVVETASGPVAVPQQQMKTKFVRNIHILLDNGSTVEEAFTEVISEVEKVIKSFDRIVK